MPSFKSVKIGAFIQTIEEVHFDESIQKVFLEYKKGKELLKIARKNSKSMRVFRIRYQSGSGSVVGYVLEPKQLKKKTPCIIFNRGGSLEFGKIHEHILFVHLARLVSWGYIVVASQYSGNDGSDGKDEFGGADIEDVLALYNVLKKHPSADTNRIGMYGGSRGGMMTYLSLARVKWIKAAVCVAGLSDLFRQEKFRPEMKLRFKKMFGGKREDLKKRSAVNWVHKFHKKTPVLLLHGASDWRVSPLDSLDMSYEMLKEKVPHRLVLFEGADHFLSEFKQERFEMTREWFDHYVRDCEKLPNLKMHGK